MASKDDQNIRHKSASAHVYGADVRFVSRENRLSTRCRTEQNLETARLSSETEESERPVDDSRKATNETCARTEKIFMCFFVSLIKSSIEDHSCQINRTLIDRKYPMSGFIMNTDQCNSNLTGFDRLELSSVNYSGSRAMRERESIHRSSRILLERNSSRLDNRFSIRRNFDVFSFRTKCASRDVRTCNSAMNPISSMSEPGCSCNECQRVFFSTVTENVLRQFSFRQIQRDKIKSNGKESVFG